MKRPVLLITLLAVVVNAFATGDGSLHQEIAQLKQQTSAMHQQIIRLEKKIAQTSQPKTALPRSFASSKPGIGMHPRNKHATTITHGHPSYYDAPLQVHAVDGDPAAAGFYPTALLVDEQVITFIAGTPVVTSPYLGERPAFDGSDYIVNISSINRDIRLMQQRRRLYNAYIAMGYPVPDMPVIALSGKVEPVAFTNQPYLGEPTGDLTLGSSELDVTAALNANVEGFMGIAYDSNPPAIGGQRVANSTFTLNQGFINIGNLDVTPLYFTAGQLYAPFGRYSSSMVSAPLPLILARTRTRPFILGYKSQGSQGPYVAAYGFKSDTTEGHSGVGGLNVGYAIEKGDILGDWGVGYIGSITNSTGMQYNGAGSGFFRGFASRTNGSEAVGSVPALDLHGNLSKDRYNVTAEWITATESFHRSALSFDGYGARPQAGQVEGSVTFKAFDKPSSIGLGYQWSREALALNLPQRRWIGVFNISIWKDTVESLEYRYDRDYNMNQYGNGASPLGGVNANTLGTGRASQTVTAQIGVYF